MVDQFIQVRFIMHALLFSRFSYRDTYFDSWEILIKFLKVKIVLFAYKIYIFELAALLYLFYQYQFRMFFHCVIILYGLCVNFLFLR